MWGALFYGGKLIIPTDKVRKDLNAFYDLCVQYQVTILSQTPSAFYSFSEVVVSRKSPYLLSFRYVIFAGEALKIYRLQNWWNFLGDTSPKLINMYGITEATIHSTWKELTCEMIHQSNIGKGLGDVRL
jgi:non-ribosomal peptide synthetase component F